LAGASILATAAGGFYVGWGLYGSKLEEVSLGGAQSAVAWFEHLLRSKDVSPTLAAVTTTQKAVQPNEAAAVHDTGDLVTNLRQEKGEASPVRPQAEAANITPAAEIADPRNPDVEIPRHSTMSPPIPPSTQLPASAGTLITSVQDNKPN